MKRRSVQLDVKSQRVVRFKAKDFGSETSQSTADADDRRKIQRWRRNDGELESSLPKWVEPVMTWAIIGVGVLLMVGMIYFWAKRHLLVPQVPALEGANLDMKRVEPNVDDRSVLSESAAVDLVRRGLATRDLSKVRTYFRLGSGVVPSGVVEFLEGLEKSDGLVVRLVPSGMIHVNGQSLGCVQVKFEMGGVSKERLALLVLDEDLQWKIDYEALARRADPSWASIMDGRAEQGIVRVSAARAKQAATTDESEWDLYQVDSPDVQVSLRGYCRKGTAVAKALLSLVGHGQDPARVTLVVRPMASMPTGNVEIIRVLAQDWVVSDRIFDESFEVNSAQ